MVDGKNMQLIWAEFQPGSVYPVHSHEREQFSFMLSGRMRLTVGDEVSEVGAGDMWYAPSNVEHGARSWETSLWCSWTRILRRGRRLRGGGRRMPRRSGVGSRLPAEAAPSPARPFDGAQGERPHARGRVR